MSTQKKILIIDDDSFLLDMYSLKFSQSGYEVESSLGSVQAYEKLKKGFSPDLILMDIVMPEMNGFELLEKISKEKLTKDVPIIMLSNRGQQGDIDQAMKLGAVGYIVKANTTPSEVITKVDQIISSKK